MSDSENTPNLPENGLTWLDCIDTEQTSRLIDWLRMSKKEFLETLVPFPAAQQFIEMALNPSNVTATNHIIIPNGQARWIDES